VEDAGIRHVEYSSVGAIAEKAATTKSDEDFLEIFSPSQLKSNVGKDSFA
jgi:hypothetical protein